MNVKTLSVILSALAVIAACVFGVIHTNSKTAIANANAAKAENEAAAFESEEKIAKSNERTETAKADAAKAAERRAESERKTAEAEAEAARVNNEKALADKAREEAELQKAKELRLKAEADAKTAAEKSAAEKAKADAAKALSEKAKRDAAAEAAKAEAAAAELEREKLASEKIIAEKKVYEFRLMDIARMERELAEYKMELDERERALHPEKTIRDLEPVGTEEAKSPEAVKLPENDPGIPRGSRALYRSKRILSEMDDATLAHMRSNAVLRLEKLYLNALKEDRVVDAQFYETQLKTMYPDWKFTTKETESK